MFSDIASIYIEGRRAQVNALNVQKFSDGEYTWVRRRVYEAAGMEIAGGIDMSEIEKLAREKARRQSNIEAAGDAEARRARSEHQAGQAAPRKVKEWIPMAVLGLVRCLMGHACSKPAR